MDNWWPLEHILPNRSVKECGYLLVNFCSCVFRNNEATKPCASSTSLKSDFEQKISDTKSHFVSKKVSIFPCHSHQIKKCFFLEFYSMDLICIMTYSTTMKFYVIFSFLPEIRTNTAFCSYQVLLIYSLILIFFNTIY